MVNELAKEFKVKTKKHYMSRIVNNGFSVQSSYSFVRVILNQINKRCIFSVQILISCNENICWT